MRIKRISAAVALTAAGALVISGCAAGGGDSGDDSGLVEGSSITAAWNQAFYSYNGNTSFGNATANNNINYMALDGFNVLQRHPGAREEHVVRLVREDLRRPADDQVHDRRWRQLVGRHPVDAADLMLHWAALSRALDTPDFDPAEFTDPDTGEFTDAFPTDVVYFDSGATPDSRFGLVHDTPEISDDGKSITLDYSAPFVDWELAFGLHGEILPAHVVGKNALGIEDNEEAKQAVIDAIQNEDDAALAPISSLLELGLQLHRAARRPRAVPLERPVRDQRLRRRPVRHAHGEPGVQGRQRREHRRDHGPLHPRPARSRPGARER